MHIVILASTPGIAEEIKVALGGTADRCSVVVAWSDVILSIQDHRPDLILVERAALAHAELGTLLSLTEPGRWPPLLLVDSSTVGVGDGSAVVQRLVQEPPNYYQVGELRIDTRKRRAGLGQRWVTLPPIQYRLLLALAKRAGEVISSQELLRLVWGYDSEETEARELVKVHIRQIRRRLGLDPKRHSYIRSVRGFGYMLTSPDED
jgi:DNA-binding winged helix-turn-helix (wHTH) protein